MSLESTTFPKDDTWCKVCECELEAGAPLWALRDSLGQVTAVYCDECAPPDDESPKFFPAEERGEADGQYDPGSARSASSHAESLCGMINDAYSAMKSALKQARNGEWVEALICADEAFGRVEEMRRAIREAEEKFGSR